MLDGFALDIWNCMGHMGNHGNGGNMLYPLAGQGKGKTARIYGNGPSLSLLGQDIDPDAILTIACNNALASRPSADIWLVAECEVHRKGDWFFDHTGYRGLTIFDGSMVLPQNDLLGDNDARKEAGLSYYSAEFLGNALWYLRQGLDGMTTGPVDAFLSFADGLYGYLPTVEADGPEMAGRYEHGELCGSVLMQAIHLAAGMGCEAIELSGCELSWQKGEPQHADGSVTFTPDGEPVNRPIEYCGLVTTPYFLDSAKAIRWFARNAGVTLINHSAGLLDMVE